MANAIKRVVHSYAKIGEQIILMLWNSYSISCIRDVANYTEKHMKKRAKVKGIVKKNASKRT